MLKLRKVTQDDAGLLFDWANEPEARANAINPKAISWDEHTSWLTHKLSDNSAYLHILTDLKKNIGIIRFEKSPEGFVVSYSIDKDYRNKGFGVLILEKGMEKLSEIVESPIFIGYVKEGNIASEKIFNSLNFAIRKEEIINGAEFIIYQK